MKDCLGYWFFLELLQHLLVPGILFFYFHLLHLPLHFLLLQFLFPNIFLIFSPCKYVLHDIFLEDLFLPSFLGLRIDGNHDDDALLRGEAHLYKFLSLHEGDGFPLVESTLDEEFDAVRGKVIAEFIDEFLHGLSSLHLNCIIEADILLRRDHLGLNSCLNFSKELVVWRVLDLNSPGWGDCLPNRVSVWVVVV